MKRLITLVTVSLLGLAATFGTARAAEKKQEIKKQERCPVMGGKINKKQFVDVKGKRIYVCCPGCIGKVKADPDKYIKALEDKGITLEKAPTKDAEKAKDKGKN